MKSLKYNIDLMSEMLNSHHCQTLNTLTVSLSWCWNSDGEWNIWEETANPANQVQNIEDQLSNLAECGTEVFKRQFSRRKTVLLEQIYL